MATVGQQLTAPEAGWKRYDDREPYIIANFMKSGTGSDAYNGTVMYTGAVDAKIRFRFKGTKLRIIGVSSSAYGKVNISIDGITETFDQHIGIVQYQTVVYEKFGLTDDFHIVEMTLANPDGTLRLGLDAIDIDENGALTAMVGEQLTTPETGWKRYDDTHPAIKYHEGNSSAAEASSYNGTRISMGKPGSYNQLTASFSFKGTKIRYIGPLLQNTNAHGTTENILRIDGVDYKFTNFNDSANLLNQILICEISNLTDSIHKVEIIRAAQYLHLDAIDIDSTGRLLHPDEVTDPKDLVVGKRIRAHYQATSNTVGTFSGLGEETSDFIPPASSNAPNGDFYFIMVDEGNGVSRLVADRNVQHSISWDTLNNAGIAAGSGLQILKYSDLVPIMTAPTSNNITVTASSKAADANDGWKAFDSTDSSAWATATGTTTGWIEVDFGAPVVVNKYSIKNANIARLPKNWTFQGWNGTQWIILDTQSNINNWNTDGKLEFAFNNNEAFLKYKIDVTANNGDTSYLAITTMQLIQLTFSNLLITTRLLTGGTAAADKDNEWDQYIVSGTGNGAYTAGDNGVWNWSGKYSWTSSVPNGNASNRAMRGSGSVSEYASNFPSNYTSSPSGFRPVLEIESLVPPFILLNKSLVLSGGSYQKWQAAETQEGDMVKDLTYSEEGTLLRYNLHKQLTHVEVE